jgi:hypothetical protein
LTSITIPNSVTSIGYGAFYNCSAIKSVVIGEGIKSIAQNAFDGIYGNSTLTIKASIPPATHS